MRKRESMMITGIVISSLLLSSCSIGTKQSLEQESNQKIEQETEQTSSIAGNGTQAETIPAVDVTQIQFSEKDNYVEYESEGTTIEFTQKEDSSGEGYEIKKGILTISKAGTYIVSGSVEEGQLVVDAPSDDDIRIVLDALELSSSTSAPIYVKSADKVILSLPENTESTIQDQRKEKDDEITAAVYSKDSLTINGSGSLHISSAVADGITCKDTLRMTGGTIEVTAADDGIVGRDAILYREGMITITCDGDGMKTTNTEQNTGYVYLGGGNLMITAKQDGIQAETSILMESGNVDITTNGGSVNGDTKTHEQNDWGKWKKTETESTQEETTPSAKGWKASGVIEITGGALNMNTSDDSIHADDSVKISGGSTNLQAGDDGIHADTSFVMAGGEVTIKNSYEGIEAMLITITDGKVSVIAQDDGINATSGSSESSSQGGRGGMDADPNCQVKIMGGELSVDAGGDGLDSNGLMTIEGGMIYINGPEDNGNGIIDSGSGFTMNGGTVLGVGSSGMLETPEEDSKQRTIVYAGVDGTANTIVAVKDSSGKILAELTSTRSFTTVIMSSTEIQEGEEYTILINGSPIATVKSEDLTTVVGQVSQGGQGGGHRR